MKRSRKLLNLAALGLVLSTSGVICQTLNAPPATAQELNVSENSPQTETLARKRKRRCRWVPGHGLVCEPGWFGFGSGTL